MKNKKYNIILNGNTNTYTMSELGSELVKVYDQLRKQGVLKEDARGYLPSNIECGKLYMTFTYRNLIKFLELRTDKAAQAEIRKYALEIEKDFVKNVGVLGDIYKYLLPKYVLSENNYDYSGIDEVLEEFEEEVSDN